MTQANPIIRRALISVSDKTGIADFAQQLAARGVELVSTGGTAKTLRDSGLAVRDVSELTGFPEMLDGRVKTLHPAVHGGLLAIRDNAEHSAATEAHGIAAIDLLVIDLYPFEATIARDAGFEVAVENIDIGGPAMIRAAAKNHDWVAVVTDPQDYAALLAEMERLGGATSLDLRRTLAAKAYARTAVYDAAIANWFAGQVGEAAPRHLALPGTLRQTLRYGENPHQSAAFYVSPADGRIRAGVATARQVQGKELSYNNLNDTDAAYELAAEFDPALAPAVAIIKHANPCGVAVGASLVDAYRKALLCDPVSAFGGIVALNGTLDAEAARAIAEIFTEVIIAPDATPEAQEILAKKKNLRLLLAGALPDPKAGGFTLRTVAGGFLVQSRDNGSPDALELKVATERAPSAQELADLIFAFRVCKHVKSNAIVFAKGGATVGIGAGQMSRVDSARIAAWKGEAAAKAAGLPGSLTEGSVAASDAFFPFADGLLALADAGATSVIQPGGSMRDDEVIAAANERGLAMVLTGMRHFRH
ncbi:MULTISPECIES: bifunctional phosphoribosylaminoimidazolecarboxamide formyltransferase/IMP cyclohydrolase [Rhodomicrobium]|uniref:bifunctional phosphoribosylaminoimidazolecarboxamide formyltransferase/IMP cyclohydrolase n=1 Tax=Rhodomicrobium TaxID=1068 RepID=UPI000B4BAFEE|nr:MULTISPECIES: bifunctional phosphoribosylaminoimidazolecarboxamide formyltransferase/IMP cyclohydrolase [Rhodomicrobium]